MAKIRVYELARELSLSNKALIDKLEKMNISVKSHMSVIEDKDELLQKIRGAETESPVLDEIRVKSTVIRRRKKSIKISSTPEVKPEKPSVPVVNDELPPESSEIPESPESPESPEPPESIESLESTESPEAFQSSESSESEDIEKEKIDLPPQESEEITDEEVKKEEKDIRDKPPVIPAKQNKRRKKGKDVSAKIIKLPDPVIKKSEPPTSDAEPLQESDQSVPPYRKKAASAAASKIDADEIEGVSDSSKKDEKKKDKFVKADEDKKAAALQKKKGFKKEETFKWKEVIERGDIHTDVIPSRKKKKGKRQKGQKTQLTTPKASKRRIKIDETIILSELGKRMGVKSNEIIAKLMSMGVMVTVNQTIDFETASLVASEFGFETYKAAFEESDILENIQDDPEKMIKRPPIVTIMGHVDHGKTSLLDVIRKTKVIDTETGGITQHIGAYSVKTDRGEITFLDTPGHEAFTSMRARGAMVTDIVVLVVAADDGVMPQTIEAINHSKVANVPIIVAINKIDKPGTNYERIERELSEQGLISEKWGGDTIFVNVSAKKNIGIDELLEMILIQADMLELKANPDKQAYGYVIEAKLDLGKGPVATVLVQEGTLKTGDIIVCGIHYGKVRALIDDLGNSVDSAEPSIPVEVLGLSGVPVSGDKLISTSDEKKAKQISSYRTQKQRFVELAKTNRMNLEALFEKMQKGEVKSLNLIIKADVQGSIEALKESLTQLSIDEVEINIIHFATGTITETDISLAAVSNAIIIGFNVRPSGNIAHMADEEHVDIRYYDIIYDVINDIKNAVVGLMKSTFKENVLGRAGVRKVFHVPKIGTVAGCHVMDGKIERNKKVRILREGVILYDGNISSLKRYKDDVKEVLSGYECGISIEKYNDIKESDIIESYFIEEIKPDINL